VGSSARSRADPRRRASAEVEKARRKLDSLVTKGTAVRRDDEHGIAHYFERRDGP
jgi:hypothetical protein